MVSLGLLWACSRAVLAVISHASSVHLSGLQMHHASGLSLSAVPDNFCWHMGLALRSDSCPQTIFWGCSCTDQQGTLSALPVMRFGCWGCSYTDGCGYIPLSPEKERWYSLLVLLEKCLMGGASLDACLPSGADWLEADLQENVGTGCAVLRK